MKIPKMPRFGWPTRKIMTIQTPDNGRESRRSRDPVAMSRDRSLLPFTGLLDRPGNSIY